MDNKRFMLAMALIFGVLLIYQLFFMKAPQPPQTATQQEAGVNSATGQQEPPPIAGETTPPSGDTKTSPDAMPDIFAKEDDKKETPSDETPKADAVSQDIVAENSRDIIVETDLFTAVFTSEGAGLKTFTLKNYNSDKKKPLNLISKKVETKFGDNHFYPFYFSPFIKDKESVERFFLDINKKNFVYEGDPHVVLSGSEPQSAVVEFKYAEVARNLSIYKRFTFTNNSYVIESDYRVVVNGKDIYAPIIFGPDLENDVSDERPFSAGLQMGGFHTGGNYDGISIKDLFKEAPNKDAKGKDEAKIVEAWGDLGAGFNWIAYESTYFGALFKTPAKVQYKILKVRTTDANGEENEDKDDKDQAKKLYSYIIVNNPKSFYLGPKDEQILAEVEKVNHYSDANKVIDYGWEIMNIFAKIMQKCIVWIYSIIPNYGWALIIFTIFVKLILFPLTYTSSVSMAKMQTLQPKIKAIKKKYKNLKDPEQRRKMNEETMALYKTEKVNPAGGCLPMLLQMPILFAFFRLVPISINFRHEAWILWITDLSFKDPTYILPILMSVTQIMVTKMSPSSGDSAQNKMMYLMPIAFFFILMNYSSGLMLYWVVSNVLQMGQQYIINKRIYQKKKDEDKMKKEQKRKKGGKAK